MGRFVHSIRPTSDAPATCYAEFDSTRLTERAVQIDPCNVASLANHYTAFVRVNPDMSCDFATLDGCDGHAATSVSDPFRDAFGVCWPGEIGFDTRFSSASLRCPNPGE